MRTNASIIITACLFSLLLVLSFINSDALISITDELRVRVESLPDEPSCAVDSLSQLSDFWESRRELVGLTVPRAETDAVGEYIAICTVCAKSNNRLEYKKSMAQLLRAIDNIARLERVDINIFQ